MTKLVRSALSPTANSRATQAATPVTVGTFIRAESDLYFVRMVKDGGFGKFHHSREMTSIDKQNIVRMNRDTLYSSGVFDLEAAPATVTLPDSKKRFMSMLAISEDHYANEVVYAPGRYSFTRERIGTRYVALIIRTLANPRNSDDMAVAHALQDAIKVEQARIGAFVSPNWEQSSQTKIRDALNILGTAIGERNGKMFGAKNEVDPVVHLIGTAIGWGGNPRTAAVYASVVPKQNDSKTVHKLTVVDAPVDGFWSISVYNAKGYFEKNDFGAYSVNSITAARDPNGSYTIQFGGCGTDTPNCLPIMPGWNYTVRLYRPHREILDGNWKFPDARPVT